MIVSLLGRATFLDESSMMFGIIVAGLLPAIILSMLAVFFLQSDDLFQAKYSVLYCSLIGAFLAAVATLGMLDLSLYFWGVVVWGLLSGAVFRLLLGWNVISSREQSLDQ